jgi:hypothetical protein
MEDRKETFREAIDKMENCRDIAARHNEHNLNLDNLEGLISFVYEKRRQQKKGFEDPIDPPLKRVVDLMCSLNRP